MHMTDTNLPSASEARRRIALPWEVDKFEDSACRFISGDALIRVTASIPAGRSAEHTEYLVESAHGRKGWQFRASHTAEQAAQQRGYMGTRLKGLLSQWPVLRISEWGHLLRGRHNGFCADDCPHAGTWERLPELSDDEREQAWQAMIAELSKP